jgi:hypothetical protein
VNGIVSTRPDTVSSPHRYFAAWPYSSSQLMELPHGSTWEPSFIAEWKYPLGILAEAEKQLKTRPLHFYFTKDADNLPEYGDHVVAILWLEERCKMPAYARYVRAAGEIRTPVPKSTYRYWVPTSKTEARLQLWKAMLKAKQNPEWRIDMRDIAGGERTPRAAGFGSYSQKMMNTRLCVAPRGITAESFRMYEGWRAGCMVIANRLPPEPFLKGAPVIEVDNWKVLPDLLKKYARDIDALEHYRKASLDFWKNHLSEQVIGQQVAHFLNGCPGGCP